LLKLEALVPYVKQTLALLLVAPLALQTLGMAVTPTGTVG